MTIYFQKSCVSALFLYEPYINMAYEPYMQFSKLSLHTSQGFHSCLYFIYKRIPILFKQQNQQRRNARENEDEWSSCHRYTFLTGGRIYTLLTRRMYPFRKYLILMTIIPNTIKLGNFGFYKKYFVVRSSDTFFQTFSFKF